MRKARYSSAKMPSGLNPEVEGDRLILEVGRVITATTEKPRDEAFAFAMGAIPDPTLDSLLDGAAKSQAQDDDHPAAAPFMLLAIALRGHLHGDKRGGFEATEDELIDIVNTLAPYLVIEFARRRECFEGFDLPASPWAADATVRVRVPRRDNIEATVAELKRRGVFCPPLLADQEALQEMEDEGTGIEMPVGVRGRSIVSPQANVQPHKAPALDPQAFMDAISDVNARAFSADFSQTPLPQGMPSEVDYEDGGQVRRLNVREIHNSPQGRMMQIMRQHFGGDFEQYSSAILRFNALMDLLRKDALASWTQHTPQGLGMHTAILTTAATMKLTKGGLFPPARFVREVEDLAAQE